MLYGVVTMDIVNSRGIESREKVQNKLIDYINMINARFSNILVSPVSITLGDEWQLITDSPFECYNLVHEFKKLLWKDDVEFYAGIGIGSISTLIYDDIRKMDGPCFHMSRDAINIAKNHKRSDFSSITSKHNRVYFIPQREAYLSLNKDFGDIAGSQMIAEEEAALTFSTDVKETPYEHMGIPLGSLINTIIENNEILISKMTMKQKMLYIDYIKAGSYRKMLQMDENKSDTVGGISQKLNSAEFFTIQNNLKTIAALLKYYYSV